jgi:hypothetical protein
LKHLSFLSMLCSVDAYGSGPVPFDAHIHYSHDAWPVSSPEKSHPVVTRGVTKAQAARLAGGRCRQLCLA